MLADVSLAELVDFPEKSGADEVVLLRQGRAILCHDQGFLLGNSCAYSQIVISRQGKVRK